MKKTLELDRIDRRLLTELQRNSQLSTPELAEIVGASVPTCYRRIKRLRESGAITADVCLVDPLKVGAAMLIVVEVELERERLDLHEAFKRAMAKAPEVTQCYGVTGEFDFVLMVMVPDLDSYNRFTEKAFYGNANVRKFRSLFVLHRVKFSTAVPLLP